MTSALPLRVLTNPEPPEPPARPVEPPAAVLRRVADHYGVTAEALAGPARTRWISQARKAACRELHDLGLSYAEVGALLGGRDYTTVMYLTGAR